MRIISNVNRLLPKFFDNALKKMKLYESLEKMGQKELPPQINSRVIEITLEG